VTAAIVSPVSLPPMADGRRAGTRTARRTLPVAQLAPPSASSVICGTAAVDCNGRVAEATVIRVLGWVAGTRLNITVSDGLVLLTADPHAVFCMTRPGQVRLPAAVRHWCGLTPGSRVLLVADPDAGLLVVHPPGSLHTMISQFHAAVLGGDRA
jgi:hypothetical protein